jgi:hypothetical protein
VSLVWPRCKVCRSKFRVRLPLKVGFATHYVGRFVLLGSLAAGVAFRSTDMFTMGFAAFVALEVAAFRIGRLEPDIRDPITMMQLRRYRARGSDGSSTQ